MSEGIPFNSEGYDHEKSDFTEVHNPEFQNELREEVKGGLGYLEQTIKTYDENVDRFVEARDKKRLDIEMDIFQELVPASGKVLDAGCGYGGDSGLLKDRGYRVIGADLSAGLIAEARKRNPVYTTSPRKHSRCCRKEFPLIYSRN